MRKLSGARVVVTRAIHQAEDLARPLRALGAAVISVPVIGIESVPHPEALRQAASQCHEYDWIIFNSANAVSAFVAELLPRTARDCKARVAAVGSATRRAAEDRGFTVAITPDKYVAESLVDAFGHDLTGQRILIPSAAVTRDVVANGLRKRGAQVDLVEAYRNVIPADAQERASAVFREPFPDWVTFSSSSAVDNLITLIGAEPVSRVKIASIGPITSAAIRKHDLSVTAEAGVHTVQGLVDAIVSLQNPRV
jgi:uroporphyrinogen-III synthase